MKNFRFYTNCNITQEPQELQRYNRACRFIGKSAVIKCHQVLSKLTSINRRSLFEHTPSICILSYEKTFWIRTTLHGQLVRVYISTNPHFLAGIGIKIEGLKKKPPSII